MRIAVTLTAVGATITVVGATIAHPVMWLGLWVLAAGITADLWVHEQPRPRTDAAAIAAHARQLEALKNATERTRPCPVKR